MAPLGQATRKVAAGPVIASFAQSSNFGGAGVAIGTVENMSDGLPEPFVGTNNAVGAHLTATLAADAFVTSVTLAASTVTGGSGTDQFEYISTKDGVPEAGVNVWVTSTNDPTFDVVGGTLISNAQGKTVFMLNPGSTYYVWEMKDGVNFNSPEEVEL